MLYCEGTLIMAYGRPHDLVYEGPSHDKEHFRVVLVVNLPKKESGKDYGFEPDSAKIKFDFDDCRAAFWVQVKERIDEFVSEMRAQRDIDNPLRPVFLKCLDIIENKVDIGGMANDGVLPGVLVPVSSVPLDGVMSGSASPTYASHIKEQISLQDIRLKVKSEGSADPKYKGDTKVKTMSFTKDVQAAFKNAISWETKGRFIPDTDDFSLSISSCTEDDIKRVVVKPYTVNKKDNVFTIKTILKKLGIPPEFEHEVIARNRESFPELARVTPSLIGKLPSCFHTGTASQM